MFIIIFLKARIKAHKGMKFARGSLVELVSETAR